MLASIVTLTASAAGGPTEKRACLTAYEQGQELRNQSKLRDARSQFATCAQASCPALARSDCVRWARELDDRIPTLIFRARDASGRDLADVRVTLDGSVVADGLAGKGIPVDPGRHTLQAVWDHQPPVDQEIVVNEGEKDRIVPLAFGGEPATPSPEPAADAAPRSGMPLGFYVLGGVGIVGVGLSIAFEVAGFTGLSPLYHSCAPNCAKSTVDGYVTDLRVGDVAGAVGLVAIGGAVWMALTRPREPVVGLRVSPFPLLGGAGAGVDGVF
jgi:hypothetical protein